MKELKNILSFYQGLKKSSLKSALASVVYIEGSSYRRMGARMLIAENGDWVGGISGGCLEGDALKRAKMAILRAQASIVRYDTTTDDDHQIGVGLGCNGIIDVLFKPINFEDVSNPLEVLKEVLSPFTAAKKFITITESKKSELLGQTFSLDSFKEKGIISHSVWEQMAKMEVSQKIELESEETIFYEIVPPSIELVLIGHQYDIYPLINLCEQMGWQSTVVAPSTKVKVDTNTKLIQPEALNTFPWHAQSAVGMISHSVWEQMAKMEVSQKIELESEETIFFEVVPPSIELVLIGHQYDIYPLMSLCKQMGWQNTVVAPFTKVKVDQDTKLIQPEALNTFPWHAQSAVILMSHSLLTDKNNLRVLHNSEVPYIGMLGPKERANRIFSELRLEGLEIDESRIFAPVGLDIGASSPEEISLSIIAEIKAFFAKRNAGHLRDRQSTINDRNPAKKFL